MAKVAVAHTPILDNELGELEVHVGQKFPIVEEPKDFTTMMIFIQLERDGQLDKAVVVDFGEGYVIFSKEPDEKGRTIKRWFDIEEVA